MDSDALAALADEPLGYRAKGFPLDGRYPTIRAVRDARPDPFEDGFVTPLATLSASAIENNLARMTRFVTRSEVRIAPHAKTTMAPQLFDLQLRGGAWGLTVATPWQACVCRRFGVQRLLLANELTDPAGLAWIADELRDPDFEFLSYVDDPGQVARNDEVLARCGSPRPLDVLIELGHRGGRTGCRDQRRLDAVVDAVTRSPHQRLVGIAGYEGTIGHPPAKETVREVRSFLGWLRATAERLAAAGALGEREVILTAGGSAFFDLVVEHLVGPLADGRSVNVILRSGAYLSHDDGLYATISPFSRDPLRGAEGGLEAAVEVWSRVLSRPEAEVAYIDAGRRDLPLDAGMPRVRRVRREGIVTPAPLDWEMFDAQDQHGYIRVPPEAALAPGDLVSLGISHPCTLFDKWRWLPMVDDDGRVTDVVRTFF